jgi:uncharacterized protein
VSTIDFAGARQYALQRLERELSPMLSYHSVEHTRDDVLPASKRLAELEGVQGEALCLLLTAAWYHDIGFVEQYADNEEIAARIAAQALPSFGYSLEHIQVIHGIIMATKLPQSPQTLLERVMADADLDLLGRDDYMALNQALRDEMAALGTPSSDEQWYRSQLRFLQSHRYFTASARALRDAGKQRNIEALVARIE